MFRHELMHFKSKDFHLKYLVLFLKIVYWFNP
ncbi:M56 family metallopeptidase, partial [Clostridioides difficile]